MRCCAVKLGLNVCDLHTWLERVTKIIEKKKKNFLTDCWMKKKIKYVYVRIKNIRIEGILWKAYER